MTKEKIMRTARSCAYRTCHGYEYLTNAYDGRGFNGFDALCAQSSRSTTRAHLVQNDNRQINRRWFVDEYSESQLDDIEFMVRKSYTGTETAQLLVAQLWQRAAPNALCNPPTTPFSNKQVEVPPGR